MDVRKGLDGRGKLGVRRAIRLRRESPESYVFLVSASWLYPGSMYRTNTRWLESDPKSETFQVAQAMQVYTSQAKSDPERAKDDREAAMGAGQRQRVAELGPVLQR